MDKLIQNMRRSVGGGQIDLMADIIEKLHERIKVLEVQQLPVKVVSPAKPAKEKQNG